MSTSEKFISIVVPTYNYGHMLERCLASVVEQVVEDIELLVINDGSTDDTEAILREQAGRYPFIRVVTQQNAGAAAARNHGIRLAQGRYVLLLDADDELTPGAIAELRRLVVAKPETVMVLGGQISVYSNGQERRHAPTPVPVASPKVLARRYLLQKQISISHCCSLFRRDLLLRRPYPEQLRVGEDIPVFAYLLVNGPVLTTEKLLARIHKHPGSQRHSRGSEEAYALEMVREVFATLPEECQALRRRYTAQRYLSLFRAALLAGDRPKARCYHWKAMSLSPLQAMRVTYVRKVLRLYMGG